MFYKPKFCCECSEPIERTKWSLLTDRRFCVSCETDYRINNIFYKVVIAACVVFGIIGLGTILRKPEKSLNLASANLTNANKNFVNAQTPNDANVKTFARIQENNSVAAQPSPNSTLETQKQNVKTQKVENNASAPQEIIYYCGAKTQKGTFCTHRVKGGGRCWQHAGLPAMLPQEKLIASR